MVVSTKPTRPAVSQELSTWLADIGGATALATLAELAPEAAVFVVDAERRIIHWSPGAERLLGFDAAWSLGRHCLEANRCAECVQGCGIDEHGHVAAIPLRLYRRDGHVVRVRKTARGFHDASGKFLGGIEVLYPDHPNEQTGLAIAGELATPGTRFHDLSSRDPKMLQVFQVCRNVAETTANVLIRGESGTGKELVARALHRESPRRKSPFVAVNCAALTPSLMESELFGHVRGAFTGAVRDRVGIFEQADKGSLFLDEVAELGLDMQAKLLRVLELGELTPVGATGTRKVDVRLISATHTSLREAVAAGRFREDLMFRLRVVPIHLPPLRERTHDVQLLATRFVREMNLSGPRVIDRIAPAAMRALLAHTWPGNVRELRNAIEYAFAVGRGPELQLSELPADMHQDAPPPERLQQPELDSEARRIPRRHRSPRR